MRNPYPEHEKTEERQGGGNVPVSGEKHGQKKAGAIPAERRYHGAGSATLRNSPGRASADVRDEE